ncbi:hypothetical protein [Paenibacillus kyungheensis]
MWEKFFSIIGFVLSINFLIGNIRLFLKQKFIGRKVKEEFEPIPELSRYKKHKRHFSLSSHLFFSKKYKRCSTKFYLIVFYFSCIPWLDTWNEFFGKSIYLLFSIIFIAFIGKFMSYIDKDQSSFFKVSQYIMNFFILVIYILSLLSIFDNIHQNYMLLLYVVILIIYFSTIFIRSVMMNFSNFLVVFLNILFTVAIVFFSVAMLFGFFYLENNSIFQFFTKEEHIELTSKSIDEKYYFYYFLIILNKGFLKIFSYTELHIDINSFEAHGYILMVPFFEYILYVLYSLCLLSLIISSGATRTTESLQKSN